MSRGVPDGRRRSGHPEPTPGLPGDARVDLLRRHPEEGRDLFDEDLVDEPRKVAGVLDVRLDRAPVEDDPGRVPALLGEETAEWDDLVLPGRGIARRHVLDGELDVLVPWGQDTLEARSAVDDELVEGICPCRHGRHRRPRQRSSHATSVPVASTGGVAAPLSISSHTFLPTPS